LIININKSNILTAIVFGVHTGALLLVVVMPIALGPRIWLAALIGASLWWQGRSGLSTKDCKLVLEEDGSCLRTFNGEQRRYQIVRATAHAGFVRFTLQRAGARTCTQLVPRDAVEPEVYRDLCARIVQRRLPVPERTLV